MYPPLAAIAAVTAIARWYSCSLRLRMSLPPLGRYGPLLAEMTLAPPEPKCTTFHRKAVRKAAARMRLIRKLLRFATRALPKDQRGGCPTQRQPQHAARMGAAVWLSQTQALSGEASPLHPR